MITFFPIQKFTISGHSMEPTLKDGDEVLVNKLSYVFKSPQIGDIVAAKIDGKVFIKRMTKIEDNKFILMGDNPNDSFDSRKFGPVQKIQIVGKVMV